MSDPPPADPPDVDWFLHELNQVIDGGPQDLIEPAEEAREIMLAIRRDAVPAGRGEIVCGRLEDVLNELFEEAIIVELEGEAINIMVD